MPNKNKMEKKTLSSPDSIKAVQVGGESIYGGKDLWKRRISTIALSDSIRLLSWIQQSIINDATDQWWKS